MEYMYLDVKYEDFDGEWLAVIALECTRCTHRTAVADIFWFVTQMFLLDLECGFLTVTRDMGLFLTTASMKKQ